MKATLVEDQGRLGIRVDGPDDSFVETYVYGEEHPAHKDFYRFRCRELVENLNWLFEEADLA